MVVASLAEEHKAKGNSCYHDKDYAGAVKWYTQAIEADRDNGVYYNNRAAAYMEMKLYKEAAADAERSAILAPSAKANARHGKALWLLGKTAEAAQAYERALKHDSGNPEYSNALQQLRDRSQPNKTYPSAAGAPQQGGGSAKSRLLVDSGLLIGAVLCIFLALLNYDRMIWPLMLCLMLARQWMSLSARNGPSALLHPEFWWNYAKSGRLLQEFEGLYILLCLVFLVTGTATQQLFAATFAVYASIDVAVNLSAEVRRSAPPALMPRFELFLDKVRANKDALLLNAAMFEGVCIFVCPFTGCNFLVVIALTQFAKRRYLNDNWSRLAWSSMHRQVSSYAYSPRAPAVIGTAYGYFAAFLHRAAVGA